MCTSSSRVHPEQVLEPKVFPQPCVYHLDRHSDEAPALYADLGAGAACSYVIIVCHVDIED